MIIHCIALLGKGDAHKTSLKFSKNKQKITKSYNVAMYLTNINMSMIYYDMIRLSLSLIIYDLNKVIAHISVCIYIII